MEKKTILIAEDNESNYMYLMILLRQKYNLIRANNGKEAVALAAEHHPEIILLDVKMPIMTGIEAVAEIRKQDTTTPIVMQSSYAFDQDVQLAMEKGANAYLVKPIMREKLYEVINKYIG